MIELPINVCPNTFDLLPNPKIEIFHLIYSTNVFYSVLILLQTPNFRWKKRMWKKNHLWQLSSFPVGWKLFIYLKHIWNRWTGLSSKMKPTKKMKFLSNQTVKIYWENITFGIATVLKIFEYLFSCFVFVCFHSVFFHLRFITFEKIKWERKCFSPWTSKRYNISYHFYGAFLKPYYYYESIFLKMEK